LAILKDFSAKGVIRIDGTMAPDVIIESALSRTLDVSAGT
jgi:hypothetical protein